MGQQAIGLLYGVEAPEIESDSEEPIYDLICRWEKSQGIGWLSHGLKIRNEHEGEKDLIGVWVAVGGSGQDDAAYFLDEAMKLADVERNFAKDIKKAKTLWDRFAKNVAKREPEIVLGEPTLWLTPCEVA